MKDNENPRIVDEKQELRKGERNRLAKEVEKR
jgi:hypothetical protein